MFREEEPSTYKTASLIPPLKTYWLYYLQPKMEKLYTVSKNKTGSWHGLYHELLITKFRLKLKRAGKTTRPFRYDLNQSPYDYTVEVTNRFKGLELIDRVPKELWRELHNIVQEAVIKIISKKKNGKMVVWGGLTNSWAKKSENQRRKGKIDPSESRVPKNSKDTRESLPKWSMQRNTGKK